MSDEKFSARVLFDFDPGYECHIIVKGFQPSGAIGIRVGDESTILTFDEFRPLAEALILWVETR